MGEGTFIVECIQYVLDVGYKTGKAEKKRFFKIAKLTTDQARQMLH